MKAVLLLVVLMLAACEQAERDNAAELVLPPGTAVEVTLTEFRIGMPNTLPPGPMVFKVRNAGEMGHGFVIDGVGRLSAALPPGASDQLRVVLEPGTFTVYCPVGDHRKRGMQMQLEVKEALRLP